MEIVTEKGVSSVSTDVNAFTCFLAQLFARTSSFASAAGEK